MADVRFVIWHKEKGIYLGRAGDVLAWTNTDPSFADKAPTWSESMVNGLIRDDPGLVGSEPRQCMPDHGIFATKDRVADSGLPRW
jgi:hypothetical protein